MSLYIGEQLISGTNMLDDTPIGTIIPFAGNNIIAGNYLYCDGSAVSRTTYAELFSIIGTTYGDGDGSTTFNLPDLRDKHLQGIGTRYTTVGAQIPEQLPNIYGTIGCLRNLSVKDGCFSGSYSSTDWPVCADGGYPAGQHGYNVGVFNAAASNPIYTVGGHVQPSSVAVKYYIKSGRNLVEIKADNALSSTSINPVQNKVIKEELDKKITNSANGLVFTPSSDITLNQFKAIFLGDGYYTIFLKFTANIVYSSIYEIGNFNKGTQELCLPLMTPSGWKNKGVLAINQKIVYVSLEGTETLGVGHQGIAEGIVYLGE